MPRKRVETPIPGHEAFKKTSDEAVQSQAALLLMLGRQLRGDDEVLTARARAATPRVRGAVAASSDEEMKEFPVPHLKPTGERHGMRSLTADLSIRYRALTDAAIGAGSARQMVKPLSEMADQLYAEPTTENAAKLMEAALRHPSELTRVAAASAYFELTTQPQRLIKILEDGTSSEDTLVRDVAATALARVAPDNPRLRALSKRSPTKTTKPPSHTSLLVHGTFARTSSWWQPGGDFHNYVLANVRPDLYSASDRFEWSGAYSDAARSLGATQLRDWVQAHGLSGLDLFGHSHGANISMLATQMGLTVGTLVLMSCPVHIPKYIADFTRVTRTVSIHVRLDLVVLADRGGQKFNHPNIEEHVLPVWFNHSATHDPAVWQKYNIKTMLNL
ncbi:MAG: hypothetical protein HY231_16995 [Acidobacteria bacterium]|nr:hypothetical protein [Acidobacteriota bacterium]